MDRYIMTVYVLTDDLLKSLNHHKDSQCEMSDAEILTTTIVAAMYFGGKMESSRWFLHEQGYMPRMLSRRRLNRRLHRAKHLFLVLFQVMSEMWKEMNDDCLYILDSFPIPVCDNIRIQRCLLYQEEQYRGYQASKRRYFYGLKVHLLVTAQGEPVELFLIPGSFGDVSGLDLFDFDLPEGSLIYGDKVYN